jgi:hypothetical protein
MRLSIFNTVIMRLVGHVGRVEEMRNINVTIWTGNILCETCEWMILEFVFNGTAYENVPWDWFTTETNKILGYNERCN